MADAIAIGEEKVDDWYVHNKTKKRSCPANYLALKEEDMRKFMEIKKIDRHIAIGFLLLKSVYGGADAQTNGQHAPRIYHHATRNETTIVLFHFIFAIFFNCANIPTKLL